MRKPLAIAALLLSTGAFAASDDIKPCEVIPAADVESTLGFKVVNTRPGYRECNWRSAAPDVYAGIKAFKRAGQKTSGKETLDQMAKMGWKTTILDDTPDLFCSKMIAPASMSGAQLFDCHVLTKGHYFEVQAVGATMTREKLKALAEKVAARLP